MITEDYVSFETAKLLKEKGFDCEKESITAMYREDGKFYSLSSADPYYYDYNDFDEYDYIAPTLQMAMKWLREEHGLFIGLVYQRECLPKADKWFWKWNISNKHNKFAFVEFGESDSYEEACEVAIKYCLEKLI